MLCGFLQLNSDMFYNVCRHTYTGVPDSLIEVFTSGVLRVKLNIKQINRFMYNHPKMSMLI